MVTIDESITEEVDNLVFSAGVKYEKDIEYYWVVCTPIHTFKDDISHNKKCFIVLLNADF